jgi:hypothetical protein
MKCIFFYTLHFVATDFVTTAATKAARSGDHRAAACAMTLRVCARSRLLCNLPSTHHSRSPFGHTTAGKS